MEISIKDILRPCNISDSWCESKVMRINDILSSFALQCYDCYTMKQSQWFNFTDCETTFETEYPIARVWGFVANCACPWCKIQPLDCCEWWSRLIINQWRLWELDKNMYAIEFPNKVHIRTSANSWRWILIYSRGFPEITTLSDTIELDAYTLSLLRLYIKMEYALEADNDATLASLYSTKFKNRLDQINKAFGNHIIMIPSGWTQIKAQF